MIEIPDTPNKELLSKECEHLAPIVELLEQNENTKWMAIVLGTQAEAQAVVDAKKSAKNAMNQSGTN